MAKMKQKYRHLMYFQIMLYASFDVTSSCDPVTIKVKHLDLVNVNSA